MARHTSGSAGTTLGCRFRPFFAAGASFDFDHPSPNNKAETKRRRGKCTSLEMRSTCPSQNPLSAALNHWEEVPCGHEWSKATHETMGSPAGPRTQPLAPSSGWGLPSCSSMRRASGYLVLLQGLLQRSSFGSFTVFPPAWLLSLQHLTGYPAALTRPSLKMGTPTEIRYYFLTAHRSHACVWSLLQSPS